MSHLFPGSNQQIPVDSLEELVENIHWYGTQGSQRQLLDSVLRSCRDHQDKNVLNLLERLQIYYLLPESFDYNKAQICSALQRTIDRGILSGGDEKQRQQAQAIDEGMKRVALIRHALKESLGNRSSRINTIAATQIPGGPLLIPRPLGTPGHRFPLQRQGEYEGEYEEEEEGGRGYELGLDIL